VLDKAPTVSTPTIDNTTPKEGDTLTASASAGQGDNAVTYQWFSSADSYTNPIGTGATYVVKEGDEGFQIEVKATATNDNGVTVSATSTPTAAVLDKAPPVITVGPTDSTTGSVVEDPSVVTLTTSGTLSFSDLVLSATHTAAATSQSGDFGTLTAVVSHDTTGTGTGGVLTRSYQVSEAKVQTLAAGQIQTDNFNVTGHG
jgi:VCBS repeat-containing protein